jgi:hypothetical protein
MSKWNAVMLYGGQENLWTPKVLSKIKLMESTVKSMPEYRNQFCPAEDPQNGDFSCARDSIFSVIDYIEKYGGIYDIESTNQTQLDDALRTLI